MPTCRALSTPATASSGTFRRHHVYGNEQVRDGLLKPRTTCSGRRAFIRECRILSSHDTRRSRQGLIDVAEVNVLRTMSGFSLLDHCCEGNVAIGFPAPETIVSGSKRVEVLDVGRKRQLGLVRPPILRRHQPDMRFIELARMYP